MWCLLASQLLFPSLAMMLQADLSSEGAHKVWLPFPLPSLLVRRASVLSGGQGFLMVGFLAEQSTCCTGLPSMVYQCHEMVFRLPLVLIHW